MVVSRALEKIMIHTGLLCELFRLPIGECSLCEILLWFPGRNVFLACAFVVFPVDQVLNFLASSALFENSADLIVFVLVVIAVWMRRRWNNRS